MAKINTKRSKGSLIAEVVPSVDHPEEVALVLHPQETVRIHTPNGGYICTFAVDGDGQVITFQEGSWFYQPRGTRLNVRRAAEWLASSPTR